MTNRTNSPTPGTPVDPTHPPVTGPLRLTAKVCLELRARELHELVLGLDWQNGWPPEAIAKIRKAAEEVAALTEEAPYR